MRYTSKELNVINVKKIMKKVRANKLTKNEATTDLNRRFDRMEKEDKPWYDDLYPQYISLMRVS